MPLRDDLLSPVPGANPSGESLRYAPLYDQIKEARREEEAAGDMGVWQRELKKADSPLVIKLAGDALATRSKDLQLAAWLTEAALRLEGYPGLKSGLELIRGMLEGFWDTLYPEIEDGDLELRATPLEWVGSRLDEPVRRVPLTRSGLDWFTYKRSREIGYEAEAATDEKKRQLREEAISQEQPTAEEFDEAVQATPESFYQQRGEQLEACLEALRALDELCLAKFGDYAPSFGPLRNTLEEVKQTIRMLLAKKRPVEAAVEEEPEVLEEPEAVPGAPARVARRRVVGVEPADREDALERVAAAARYLRQQDSYGPAPYLMLRGLRWGELRAGGAEPDPALLEPPPTEVRQQLKSLARDGSWQEVLEAAENAMGGPCGRAWLDLQRYVVRACEELGSYYDPIATGIRSELKALLSDLPQLPQWTLSDDTPTANAETQAWLRGLAQPPEPLFGAAPPGESRPAAPGEGAVAADAYDMAVEAARDGRPQEAIQILAREAAQGRSGRARFQRKVQMAQICLGAGLEAVAYPILDELAAEIERRRLEEWEAADMVAHVLALLLRAINKLGLSGEQKQKIYAWICRLDPVQALACSK